MAPARNNLSDEKYAPSPVETSLYLIKRLLVFIGSPLYHVTFIFLKLISNGFIITGLYLTSMIRHINKSISKLGSWQELFKKSGLEKTLKDVKKPAVSEVLEKMETPFEVFSRILRTQIYLLNRKNYKYHKYFAKSLSSVSISLKSSPKNTVFRNTFRNLIKVWHDFYSAINPVFFRISKISKLKVKEFHTTLLPHISRKKGSVSQNFGNIFHIIPAHTKRVKNTFNFWSKKGIEKSTTVKQQVRKNIVKTGKILNPFFVLSIFWLKWKLLFTRIPRFPRINFRRSILLIASFLLVVTSISLALYLSWVYLTIDLPSPNELSTRKIDVTTKIFDRNGLLLYKVYADENRTPVKLSEIPRHVITSTLAIEDSEFYSHPGFSIRGILRSAKRNIERGELTGGSTITQQLVKNTLLSSEKTFTRKIRELILAVQVELNYSKDEILEMYLSEVSYGGTAYGIQEASRMYFDKDVGELTIAEAALLAGIPRSPTNYSPFGVHPETAAARQKEVLRLMEINGYISKKEKGEAEAEKLVYAKNVVDIKAPHFVMYVREKLEKKYGKEVVAKGGLQIVSTLDYEIQTMAEKIVAEEAAKLEKLHATNAGAIIMNPKNGEILAMVGSKDYFATEQDGNVNVTTALRQPGSSIKIVNYAYALSHGFTPSSVIADIPTSFSVEGQPAYVPKNYDGGFRGNITLRSALAESRNIPAVKILESYGVSQMLQLGQKMGITTWNDPSRYGLSLTLGGGEVKLIDLARVYATVANYGKRPELTSVISAVNYKGKTLIDNRCIEKSPLIAEANASETIASASAVRTEPATECGGEQVLEPAVAYLLIDILKDNSARTPAFGSNSLLVIPNHPEVAVKTGTSNDLRDNLTVGFNQDYLVAVWVGNNDNTPMARVASGVTGATPIFNRIMTTLLSDKTAREWTAPPGVVHISICSITGTLPCEGCPTKTEWFLDNNKPQNHCSPEYFKRKESGDRIARER